ncbi:DUF2243 domain-containing protein [Pendulispora brunnea]|uniref:DUF2243 domain-containing protein n=1 Tax=Pendulispora brunnea TaxID=2905690 RepID=UPI00374E076A
MACLCGNSAEIVSRSAIRIGAIAPRTSCALVFRGTIGASNDESFVDGIFLHQILQWHNMLSAHVRRSNRRYETTWYGTVSFTRVRG